jgi:hypothetical protein
MSICFPVARQPTLLGSSSERLRTGIHFFMFPVLLCRRQHLVGPGWLCTRGRRDETAGSTMVCVIDMKGYPRVGIFRRAPALQFSSGRLGPRWRSPTARGCWRCWVSVKFLLQEPRFLDLFCMMEWPLAFYSSCCTTGAFRQRADGWLDFLFSAPQRFTAYFYILMVRVCSMIAWNGLVSRPGGYDLGGHDQKIHFPYWSTVPLVAIKKGLAECWCRDPQRHFILETDTQFTPPRTCPSVVTW